MTPRTIVCHRCGQERPLCARSLCARCYMWAYTRGQLIDHERATWPHADLIAEWRMLEHDGYTREQAAVRLCITRNALDQAISRQKRRELEDAS